jgi:hypothetical protein
VLETAGRLSALERVTSGARSISNGPTIPGFAEVHSDALRPGSAGLHWVTATAAPCTSLFKPVRVDDPVDLGPTPEAVFDPRTIWWRHELLHRRVMRDPEASYPRFVSERDALEREWLTSPPTGAAAFAQADALLAEWTARVAAHRSADVRPVWVRRYWRVRDRRAALPVAVERRAAVAEPAAAAAPAAVAERAARQ